MMMNLAASRSSIWLKLSVLACVVWFFWYPKRMDALYMAIPSCAILASYHDGLASEWKGFANNATLMAVLKKLGFSEADELKDESGIYQTIYWLTGRHTVAGYVPGHAHEAFGLDSGGYLAAASYVGWKAKPMELLWRIKWVPGLGKLQTTESGTRYLVFYLEPELGGTVALGLDIANGVLLATLSHDPEDVRKLAERLHRFGPEDEPARAFAGARPWREPLSVQHAFWVAGNAWDIGNSAFRLDLSSFCASDFQLQAQGGDASFLGELATWRRFGVASSDTLPGSDVPAHAAPVLFVTDVALAPRLWPFVPPSGDGLLAAYFTRRPYQGRILGLAYPSFNVAYPWSTNAVFSEWADRVSRDAEAAYPNAALKTTYQPTGKDGGILHLFSSLLEFLGHAQTKDMAFAELRDGTVRGGTHYGSYTRQREDAATGGEPSVADAIAAWQGVHPDAVAALRVDFPVAAEEFVHLGAIAKLASSMGGRQVTLPLKEVETFTWVVRALVPFGVVEVVADVASDAAAGWTLIVRTNTEHRHR